MFGLRLAEMKVFDILNHIQEGVGVRATARLCGVKPDSVTGIVLRFGDHFRAWHDQQVRGVTVHEAQLDEKWSFVGKKTRISMK